MWTVPAGTAQGAAQALRPAAGPFAGDLFAVGLLASALIALPVITATTADATGAHLETTPDLELRDRRFFTAEFLIFYWSDYAQIFQF